MNEPDSLGSSTNLRPRNRHRTREDDEGQLPTISQASAFLDGPARSASSSRAPSPLPRARPSQASRQDRDGRLLRETSNPLGFPTFLNNSSSTSAFASGLWESSWASLQGIASSLVGNEGSRTTTPSRSPMGRRTPARGSYGVQNTSAPPVNWGPLGSADKQVAAGSREDRRAQVQAKKREGLLVANGNTLLDATGRYKRRDSDEIESNRADEDDREALVYLHRVKPEDTVAGVAIKYNCPPAIFQKANRLWPNDSLQIRKIVVLPVDACGIRGRKVSNPSGQSISNLGGRPSTGNEEATSAETSLGATKPSQHDGLMSPTTETPFSSIPTSPTISVTLSTIEEPPWTHDSWVEIDGFKDAIEIARLSRKNLGFFPRSRRKSLSISDLDTPSASLDLPRPSFHSRGSSPGRQMVNKDSKARSSSASQFARRLQGPGGVGTMRSNVRSPGPAQDGLNKMFAANLPKLAPKTSFESIHSTSSHGNGGGIENIGGAIEGWVRKMAIKASNGKQQAGSAGSLREGDLIELSEDAFGLDEGPDTKGNETGQQEGRKNAITGWTAEQQESMLHEHFPPRGRVFGDSSKRNS